MPRLTPEQWEQARADYEVRGLSLRELARRYGVSDIAAGRRAKKEGWVQGQSSHLVDEKVAIVKACAAYEEESSHLPQTFRWTVEEVAKERLRADGLLAELDSALARKATELARHATTSGELESLSRTRKNLAPQEKAATTVNVSQQTAAIGPPAYSPKDAFEQLVAEARHLEEGT